MKRIAITLVPLLLLLLLLLFTVSTPAFGHAGEEHTYLGTVTTINSDGSFVIEMTNGEDRTVLVTSATKYSHADGNAAKASELAVGRRVSVRISKDGKTALLVKLSAAKKPKT